MPTFPRKPDYKFKEGDGLAFAFHTQTTDKILIATANGRFYTLGADKLPGARGFGEPVGSMIDIEAGNDIVSVFPATSNGRMLLGRFDGQGLYRENGRCRRRNAQG